VVARIRRELDALERHHVATAIVQGCASPARLQRELVPLIST